MYYDIAMPLDKQLVIDVLEPYIDKVVVKTSPENSMEFMKFGHIEIQGKEYIYGTESTEYQKVFENPDEKEYKISFAIVNEDGFQFFPAGNFEENEFDIIQDAIKYYFYCQQLMPRYAAVAHC